MQNKSTICSKKMFAIVAEFARVTSTKTARRYTWI